MKKPAVTDGRVRKKAAQRRRQPDIRATIAKIAPPRLPPAVARTRLYKLLDKARRRLMVWISAPAGAGKTTLAASYANARHLPVLWYQIDDADADIASFFHYFSLAVDTIHRRSARLPAFTPAHFPSLLAFTRRYFEAVAAALPAKAVIVFDNYQELPEGAVLHAVLHQAIGQMPRGAMLLVLSRNDPPAAFALAQARGQISLHAADALRLTDKESLALIRLHTSQHIARDLANDLHARTGGWVAGLTLLLERRHHDDPGLLDHRVSQQTLFNYLATEIFAQMSPRAQALLLKTALLPHVSVVVAEEVTGDPDSAALLADLNQRHYFTQRLAGRAATYQYHPLFREFLLDQAQRRLGRGEIRSLECTAAMAMLREGQPEEAIGLFLQSEDWDHAATQILEQAPVLISQARNETLARWLNGLPNDMHCRLPWLGYWQGICELTHNPPRAQELFSNNFLAFEAQQDRVGQAHAIAGAVDAIYIGQGVQSAHDNWIVRFEKLISNDIAFPSADVEGRIWSSVILAVCWRKPDHPRLSDWLARAEDAWSRMSDPGARLGLGSVLSFYFRVMGRRVKAEWFAKTLTRLLASRAPMTPLIAIHCRLYLAYPNVFRGETELARHIVHEALAYADSTGMHAIDAHTLGAGIYADLLDADLAAADVNLARMGEWLAVLPEILDSAHFEMLLGWRALVAGEVAIARDHAERAVRITERIGAVYPARLCRYGLSHVLVEQGNHDAAIAEINKARLDPTAAFGAWMNYQCDMLLAHLEFRRGRDDVGLRRLRSALIRGRECGFSQPLWFRPQTMAELCARALAKDIEADHVQALVQQRRLVLPATGVALSAREREILTLVAKGMNRAEIAKALGISPATVATHIGAVYRKLNISSRSEAAVEAVRLGLIRP